MFQVQSIEDFGGGMTDNTVDCLPNRFELAENFLRTPNNKLEVRPGSSRDDTVAPQVTGGTRIGAFVPFDQDLTGQLLLKISGPNVFYSKTGTMNTILGPTGNPAFQSVGVSSSISWGAYNKQLILTSDALNGSLKPQLIFKDNSGAMQLRTAGLPALAGSPSIVAFTAGTTYSYLYRFFYKYTYVREGGVTFEVDGPTLEVAATSGQQIGSPNLPVGEMNISLAPANFGNGSFDNYDFASVSVEIYRTTNNGSEFFFVGSRTSELTTQGQWNAGFADIVPDDTTVNPGATDVLVDRTPIYTSGGIFDHDPPPVCKYVHSTNQATYYANILENGETFENEIRQSVPGIPQAVPGSFSTQIDDEIVGISSIRSVPIVFGRRSVYRIDGLIDSAGNGLMQAIKISDATGAAGNLGIVQTVDALYFAGTDGFYTTDGFSVKKLTTQINTTYLTLVQTDLQKRRIYGAYEANKRRVWWAANPENDVDNGFVFVLDLEAGVQPDGSATFTTVSGKRLDNTYARFPTVWTASALVYFNQTIYRGDNNGYTFRHDYALLTDEYYNGTSWLQTPIQYDFRSAVLSFGTSSIRKWVPFLSLSAEPAGNVSVLPQFKNDKSSAFTSLKEIYVRPFPGWGDGAWGDASIWAEAGSMIRQKRNFTAGKLRCFYKQVRLSNAFVNITSSDASTRINTAVVSGTTKSATLFAGFKWPGLCVDYYLTVQLTDGTYTAPMLVTSRDSDTVIKFSDPNNACPVGNNLRWVMRGFFKGDVLKIDAINLYFMPLTPSQKPFTGVQGGNDAVQV